MESKVLILSYLQDALNECRVTYGTPIKLVYFAETETVGIYEKDSGEFVGSVNVACDSGVAMIRDILRHSYFN